MYRNITVCVPDSDNVNSPAQLLFPVIVHLVMLRLKEYLEKETVGNPGVEGGSAFK